MKPASTKTSIRKTVSFVLLMLLIGLLYLNWRILSPGLDISAKDTETMLEKLKASPQNSDVHPSAILRFTPRPQTDFAEITARPLLRETRKPVEQRPVTAEQPAQINQPPAPLNLKLLGIIIKDGLARALVSSPTQTDSLWLEQGQSIDGWTIKSISQDQIIVDSQGRVEKIQLYEQNSGN